MKKGLTIGIVVGIIVIILVGFYFKDNFVGRDEKIGEEELIEKCLEELNSCFELHKQTYGEIEFQILDQSKFGSGKEGLDFYNKYKGDSQDSLPKETIVQIGRSYSLEYPAMFFAVRMGSNIPFDNVVFCDSNGLFEMSKYTLACA